MTDSSDKEVDRNSKTDALPALKQRRGTPRSRGERGPDLNDIEHRLEALIASANSLTERLAGVSDRLNSLTTDEERAAGDTAAAEGAREAE